MSASHPEPRIHRLDPATVNQIAAGEVVERPASVVKELVENAVDAGATSILVDVTSDMKGITRIRIADDGYGMTPEEALLAFEPHATSKIREIGDLHVIRTLGFRGEALASIAAVAQVTLVTRARGEGAIAGRRVVVRGGEVLEDRETGAPEGTTVIVEDLFYNTPARRKFLKSRNTELAHLYGTVETIALAHSDIAFRLVQNGRERMATQRSAELRDAIVGLHGIDLARSLIPVAGRTPFMRIGGYVSRPAESRGSPFHISISINGRSVASRPIVGAIREGYGTLLPKDRYPVAFLDLDIDTSLVDVNVHPTKREVRLSREREILSAITDAVAEALGERDLSRDEAGGEPVQTAITPENPPLPETRGVASPEPAYAAGHRTLATSDRQLRQTELAVPREQNLLPAMEPIGQVAATYIVARGSDGTLYLVDQHAAHERVLYEQVVERRDAAVRSQELITPVILSLRAAESAIIREAIPLLAEEGFVVEEFGRDTYAVRAVPVVLGKLEDMAVVRETITELIGDGQKAAAGAKERITTIVACRGAVKAGALLTGEQMRRLIDQLAATKTPWTCPHGRPTVVALEKQKLDRMFQRT
ncbi:DNA mismatch repair protein MutL [Methanoculleus taiwanensis]|uniref:DNA mismatch repair protein MutL n=1 Tax=Methanoculleus taiwanensis TaxID=1550565 RepID=A0A498H5S9_9EURY|nr:DNA mismatch repair endonuclease MutL [Methanoculleus taiwanensis]RXE57278.1 DNA mismatch repair protein MutL [Methanoculleus taiwanensis]